MEFPSVPYESGTFRRVYAQRRQGAGPALAQSLLATTRHLAEWQPQWPLTYYGDPARPITISELTLQAALRDFQAARARMIPVIFRLASAPVNPRLSLFYDVEPTPYGNIEYIWFSLPHQAPPESLNLEVLLELLGTVAADFGAFNACIQDEQLSMVYYSQRSARLARTHLPPELQQYVPDITLPESQIQVPELLTPGEFDRAQVPEALWWLNFWGPGQAAAVGLERIRRLDWAYLDITAEGAVLNAVTAEPLDATYPHHIERLSRLLTHLRLAELQRQARSRVSGPEGNDLL